MSTFLDLVDPDSEAVVSPPSTASEASVVPAAVNTGQLTREEQVDSYLREIENNILQKGLEQIEAGFSWPEIAEELDPKDESAIPADWVQKHGMKKAKELYRIARASTMSSKDAPVGLKQNVQVVTGIIKARAHEKTGPKILNMNLVEMPLIQINFPETEVKERK